jgi:hypothetical protein
MSEQGIVICMSCKDPIGDVLDVTVEAVEQKAVYICDNSECPRYGVMSTIYELKTS